MNLTDYRTLGRSGLVVSPLALGTMTFGNSSWGSADSVSRAIFDTYVESGGNFIDTADVYSGGRSEELLGTYLQGAGLRDRVVLATKFAFSSQSGNPNAAGNGRKNVHRALQGSLKRLQTDYIDLYWMHAWDGVTPAEEVLQTFGDLIRDGRVRYFGLSNMPAWFTAKIATLAAVHGLPGPVALQVQYSLVERFAEQELVPAAREFGLGITPWSPLAGGFLSGKYRRDAVAGQGRLSGSNPFGDTKFNEANWNVLGAVQAVAIESGSGPAQVALAWLLAQPGVSAPILGASRVEQLRSNLAALDLTLTAAQLQRLDEHSQGDPASMSAMMRGLKRAVFGGVSVNGW